MKTLFDPVSLGGLSLKNRIVRSSTFERGGCDEEGRITDELFRIYEQLARGEVGLIIMGQMGVDKTARAGPSMGKIYDGSFLPALSRLSQAVQAHGCKLMAQISHCGVKATQIEEGDAPLGPSDTAFLPDRPARAMTLDEIAALPRHFAVAAARCKEAGADGVQIHAAHGYLLSQFLSPWFNRREDEYGGGIEGRGRLVLEICRAVREAVGEGYPVWIKLNSTDLAEPSVTLEEMITLCRGLEAAGLDAVELSGGLGNDKDTSPSRRVLSEEDEGTFARAAIALAREISLPVACVGGFRTPDVMERWLNAGGIEWISMSRPFICEPNLARRWKHGDRASAACISCNRCYIPKGGFGCKRAPSSP